MIKIRSRWNILMSLKYFSLDSLWSRSSHKDLCTSSLLEREFQGIPKEIGSEITSKVEPIACVLMNISLLWETGAQLIWGHSETRWGVVYRIVSMRFEESETSVHLGLRDDNSHGLLVCISYRLQALWWQENISSQRSDRYFWEKSAEELQGNPGYSLDRMMSATQSLNLKKYWLRCLS